MTQCSVCICAYAQGCPLQILDRTYFLIGFGSSGPFGFLKVRVCWSLWSTGFLKHLLEMP